MGASATKRLWEMTDVVDMLEAWEAACCLACGQKLAGTPSGSYACAGLGTMSRGRRREVLSESRMWEIHQSW
jgi:hypothetical protein